MREESPVRQGAPLGISAVLEAPCRALRPYGTALSSRPARRSNARPVRPRADTRRPWSWARVRPSDRAGMTASGSRPNTRTTSFGVISARDARFTTNPSLPSTPRGEHVEGPLGGAEREHVEREHLRRSGRRSRSRSRAFASIACGRWRMTTSLAVAATSTTRRTCDASIEGASCGRRREQHAERLRMRPERFVQMGRGQLRAQRHQVGERVHVAHPARPPPRRPRRRADRRRSTRSPRLGARTPARGASRRTSRPLPRGTRARRSRWRADPEAAGPSRAADAAVESASRSAGHTKKPSAPARIAARSAPTDSRVSTARNGRGADGVVDERRLADDDVRLELPHRLQQLSIVGRGRYHPRVAAPIEEVHDLFGDVVLLHREHDPGDVLHLPSSDRADLEGEAPRGGADLSER